MEKALVINAVTGLFGPHFPGPSLHDLCIARAGAQQVSQRGFGIAKEAIANGTVGSKAGAVAIAAEGVGDRGNDTQRAVRAIRSADFPQGGGGGTAWFACRRHGKVGAQSGEDIFGRDHVLAAPLLAGPERHLLDEAKLGAVVDGIVRQRNDVFFVDPGHDHGVDLDGVQARGVRGGDGLQHMVEPVAAGERGVALAVDGVERDIDAVEPGRGEGAGALF